MTGILTFLLRSKIGAHNGYVVLRQYEQAVESSLALIEIELPQLSPLVHAVSEM